MKMPPIYKIPEAWSAIADDRIAIGFAGNTASVRSSNDQKEYTIKWNDTTYVSDDSASYWQGYPGYPVIAVWMKQGILEYDDKIVHQFQNINWNALNQKYKRNYQKAFEEVIQNFDNQEEVIDQMNQTYEAIQKLDYQIKRKL